jgi:hypothetical protein
VTGEPIDPGVVEPLAGRRPGPDRAVGAVVKQSTETVRPVLRAGSVPDAGGPGDRATATFVDLPAMLGSLDAR